MKPYTYTILLLLIPLFTTAKKVITKTSTAFVFDLNNGYTETYSESGSISKAHTLNTFISGVEQLELHEVHIWNGKKWKELANKKSYSSDFNRGFYSGQKVIRTPLTPLTTYTLNWQKKCDYGIYCSKIYFNQKADTSRVSISLPAHLTLAINWNDTVGFDKVNYIYSPEEEGTVYTFTYWQGKNNKPPMIRVLVRDTSSLTNSQAFCNTYLKLISPVLEQPTPSSVWLDSIKNSSIPEKVKVKEVFEHVQQQIGYLQISNGLEGLCPRPVSYTLFQKQGDCKAMALAIHSYLNYLDISNKLAISATMDFIFEMDFPTVSSGNHMVCVYLPQHLEMVILDPTDKFCMYPQPSRHTQNTSIFLLDEDKPEFRDIPQVRSNIPTEIRITLNANRRDGQILYKPAGTYQWLDTETYHSRKSNFIHLKESIDIPKAIISEVQRNADSSYTGKIEVNKNNILNISENLLINQSFLPDPSKLISPKRKYSYQPAHHRYHVKIVLPKEYSLPQNAFKILETDLYSYSYSNKITEDNVLHIEYALHVKSCRYSPEQITQLQYLQTIIQNDLKTVITLQ
ncbi:MAG: hypothetical protein ACI8SA_001636 [Dokdonia sp.]|jgi:hypothetical protein